MNGFGWIESMISFLICIAGFHTALLLARQGGYQITIACRNKQRAMEAVRRIRAECAHPQMRVDWLPLDLASMASVQTMVERIRAEKM